MGRTGRALALARAALARWPGNGAMLLTAAQVLLALGRLDRAREALRRANKAEPRNAVVLQVGVRHGA